MPTVPEKLIRGQNKGRDERRGDINGRDKRERNRMSETVVCHRSGSQAWYISDIRSLIPLQGGSELKKEFQYHLL